MRPKKIIQDYFTFSRKERNGVIVLLFLILLVGVSNHFLFLFEADDELDAFQFEKDIFVFDDVERTLFEFDPNSIDSLALDSLDLPVKIKSNILKYRAKGGRFFSSNDFRRLYGMNDSLFELVSQYITIEQRKAFVEERQTKANSTSYFFFNPDTCTEKDWLKMGLSQKQAQRLLSFRDALGGSFQSKEQFAKIYGVSKEKMDSLLAYIKITEASIDSGYLDEVIELNSADSLSLQKLPGIGTTLSKRILRYRKLLGGFSCSEQLLEVYGLHPEVYSGLADRLEIDTSLIQQINVNFASYNELSAHPYIKKELARAMVDFRSRHGTISDLSVLLKNNLLSLAQYEKIKPYLETKK